VEVLLELPRKWRRYSRYPGSGAGARSTQEVEAVLGVENEVSCDPLARLRLAIQYDEKKVGKL